MYVLGGFESRSLAQKAVTQLHDHHRLITGERILFRETIEDLNISITYKM